MSREEILIRSSVDGTMQKALLYAAEGTEPRPLVVALHTGSFGCEQNHNAYRDEAAARNWHMIYPHFRGKNTNPEALCSDMAVGDIADAVAWAKEHLAVDPDRIYLIGGSGGGMSTLMLAGRHPELWTACSSWCPISDVAAWHDETIADSRFSCYAGNIEAACGGNPAENEAARAEALRRSPITWLGNAAGLTLDIATGIHDGHTGSVPVRQAMNAYNLLAAETDRFSTEDIEYICRNEAIPHHLQAENEQDPSYGTRVIHLRRSSGSVRLTLFEGGHDWIPFAAFDFFERQVRGAAPDWSPGTASAGGSTGLSR